MDDATMGALKSDLLGDAKMLFTILSGAQLNTEPPYVEKDIESENAFSALTMLVV